MRGQDLLYKMGLIKSEYIEEAKAIRHKKSYIKWGILAACFVLVIGLGTGLFGRKPQELPFIEISNSNDGMGFEGYGAYDISELTNSNPWNESWKLKALPVFKNPITYDEKFHIASGTDMDKMRKLLLEVAKRLGIDTQNLVITDDAPSDEQKEKMAEGFKMATRLDTIPDGYFDPTMLVAEAEGIKLEVDQFLTATVRFKPAVSLPEKYSLADVTTYTDVAEYLKSAYSDLIGFDNPQINISGGSRNIYGQQSYSIEFFEGGKDKSEKIVNFYFKRVTFSFNDDGELFIVRVFSPDLSQKVGNYPIISAKEAEELLGAGKYITTIVHCNMPGVEYVRKVELVYRNGRHDKYYLPYYRFYVELPTEKQENGLNTYGIYYVPAVEEKYIGNMPLWDGSFN